jgi:dihydroorotate dehydrogenase
MIKFKNGHKLTFACASGALGFDGRGWFWEWPFRWCGLLDPTAFTVVAKTITMEPRKGNLSLWHPWTCVALIGSKRTGNKGATNAIDLTNPGIRGWIEDCYPVAMSKGYKIAASVRPNDSSEARQMAGLLAPLQLAYIEVNVSCPNSNDVPTEIPQILRALQSSDHPIVLKLSFDQVNPTFIGAVDDYVDAYHAINTIPWNQMFPNRPSPIEHYPHGKQGGVSGTYLTDPALWAVRTLNTITGKPIIGGGGIMDIWGVRRFERAGAKAFSIGTCFLYYPWYPNQIVMDYNNKTYSAPRG